jgi:hypothetical protein
VAGVSIWFSLKLVFRGDGEEGDAYRAGCAHSGLVTGVEGDDGSGDGDGLCLGGTAGLVERGRDDRLASLGDPYSWLIFSLSLDSLGDRSGFASRVEIGEIGETGDIGEIGDIGDMLPSLNCSPLLRASWVLVLIPGSCCLVVGLSARAVSVLGTGLSCGRFSE